MYHCVAGFSLTQFGGRIAHEAITKGQYGIDVHRAMKEHAYSFEFANICPGQSFEQYFSVPHLTRPGTGSQRG
jgi:hypothetical protein